MGRTPSKGPYVPLAAQYFMDDAVLEAGPDAELLFVRTLSFLASVSSDGFVTERQLTSIVGIGLRAVPRRIARLQEVGLFQQIEGGFIVRSWQKWNRTAEEIGRLRAKDRDRKARKPGEEGPNSGRNPDGQGTDSEPQSSTEQSRAPTTSSEVVERATSKRGSRLPADWSLPPILEAWTIEHCPSIDIPVEVAKFIDYWSARAGAGAAKTDWNATWRNWARRAHEDRVNRGWQPTLSSDPSTDWMRNR